MLREFKLSDLDHLDDGRVSVAYAQALQRVLADCDDRPGVAEDRKIILEMHVLPKTGDNGGLDDVRVKFTVKDSIPLRKSRTYSMDMRLQAGNQRMLVFNDLSDDDVRQRTIDELGGESEDT